LLDKASEIARLESGEVKLEMAPHAIGELVSTALADCKRVSRVRPIHGEVKHEDLQVRADLPWARSALVQLIVNAHLYSWPGQPITISSERKGGFCAAQRGGSRTGDRKNGSGANFRQILSLQGSKDPREWHGMELPMAKAIVEAHGGTIDVVSRFGYGSVFTFSLRLDPCCVAGSELS
jgi:signal transduction histidine kinase